jgi:hypothetical protein
MKYYPQILENQLFDENFFFLNGKMLIRKKLGKEKKKNTKKSIGYDKKYYISSGNLITDTIRQKTYWKTICASVMKGIANTTGIIVM